MIPSLRKRHRRMWLSLAFGMPLLFVAAIADIPQPVHQDKLYQAPAKEEIPPPPATTDHAKDNQ